MMVVDYTVLMSVSSRDLAQDVRDLLKEGWQPQGGIGFDTRRDVFIQAMVKYEH